MSRHHAIEWINEQNNKCGLCDTSFVFGDNSIVAHLMEHAMNFEYLLCKNCGKRCRKMDAMKNHLTTHHGVGPADCLKDSIANLKELFEDVLKQKTNKPLKQSKAQETENAIAGLMGDEFANEDDGYDQPYDGTA